MIHPITRGEILNGLGAPYYCCMFGIQDRTYQCDMWSTVFDEVGGIGYLARSEDKVVGQLIFMPKKHARRIGLPTSPLNDSIEKTLVICCLYVLKDYGNRGIASKMLAEAIRFCKSNGYIRIEACVDRRAPHLSGMSTSFYPFRKFGFTLDESREGREYKPETRICWKDLTIPTCCTNDATS